jgi:predicted nucleotide-binding protein (sugar kinase/HSP70/actin superfamily)
VFDIDAKVNLEIARQFNAQAADCLEIRRIVELERTGGLLPRHSVRSMEEQKQACARFVSENPWLRATCGNVRIPHEFVAPLLF